MSERKLAPSSVQRGRSSRVHSGAVLAAWLLLFLHPLPAQQRPTQRWAVKILDRLLAPFRSDPFLQSSAGRCRVGLSTCFMPTTATPVDFTAGSGVEDSGRLALLEVRSGRGGLVAHRWLELDSPEGDMTFGFGPATLPFIDSGQISVQDRYGNTRWVSGMHPLPWLALPPVKYRYARNPGEGRLVSKPIPLTLAQSEVLTHKLQHVKFVGPYIPIFHDCHTFVCSVQASAQGHSAWPCYLLFKGYW